MAAWEPLAAFLLLLPVLLCLSQTVLAACCSWIIISFDYLRCSAPQRRHLMARRADLLTFLSGISSRFEPAGSMFRSNRLNLAPLYLPHGFTACAWILSILHAHQADGMYSWTAAVWDQWTTFPTRWQCSCRVTWYGGAGEEKGKKKHLWHHSIPLPTQSLLSLCAMFAVQKVKSDALLADETIQDIQAFFCTVNS